jgi:class 3 adenylate cyclase
MFSTLKHFARAEGDSQEIAFRKLLILFIATMCSICGVLWSALYCFVYGPGAIALLPLSFTVIVGSAIGIAHYTRNYMVLVYAQLICITWISAFLQWTIGGIDQSGFVSAWSFLGPLGAVIFLSQRQAIVWMLMFLFIVVISAVYEPALLGYVPPVTCGVKVLFYIMNIGTASTIVFAASAWFMNSIQKEKKRSDSLLLDILPAEVAHELKEKGYSDARQFDEVTVLFTDFKGFTQHAENLTAHDLVKEINECFSAFDNILHRHNVEKIKTVGDAYLAASGLPVANANHAADMVTAAIEIRDFMLKRKQQNPASFEVRIGVHSGHVVAGIVGVKKFAYDIWGDTVNTAARMEQHSEGGKINISQSTYELVKDNFTCEYRGEIEAKNKGKLKMYFVN